MIRVALLGLGKMGLSHLAVVRAHPDVHLVAICDTADYLLGVVGKYMSVATYEDYRRLLAAEKLDAVFVATPSKMHGEMVGAALEAGLHVFCEKPFCLDPSEGAQLTELAERKGLVNQVGYHYRFVGSFQEMKRLLVANVLGPLHHIHAEAYGPVVLRPKGSTWRTSKNQGGGCLYDYAIHAIDLVNYLVGRPEAVSGTRISSLFSRDVEDAVYSSLHFANGMSGQLATNWSDDSFRKMSTKISIWGSRGKMIADRQELQIYISDLSEVHEGIQKGWNVKYTTDLTNPVWFYLRGEEYSAQVDHFIQSIKSGNVETRSTFRSAVDADLVASSILQDVSSSKTPCLLNNATAPDRKPSGLWKSWRR